MKFNQLIGQIRNVHLVLQQKSIKAVNLNLSLRNWLVGFYIVEYEQKGEDRAEYGKRLLINLSDEIEIKGLTSSELSRCRQFYSCYPGIFGTVSQELFLESEDHSGLTKENMFKILGTLPQKLITDGANHLLELLTHASYSHLVELIKIENPTKRRCEYGGFLN